MKAFTQRATCQGQRRHWFSGAAMVGAAAGLGCAPVSIHDDPVVLRAEEVVIANPSAARPPFRFSAEDSTLLDEIEHASFRFFWEAVSPDTGMVYDRTGSDVISVCGVGFQLGALLVGVERGWITRQQGEGRALQILRALESQPSNRKAGLFYHFLEPHDASPRRVGAELVVSTVDSAVLFAGMLTAGSYFGGEVREIGDRLFTAADWSFFLQESDAGLPGEYVSLGWRPSSDDDPTEDGELIGFSWLDSGDEHRLVSFMGACAPRSEHRVPPARYYALRRQLGTTQSGEPVVWFPYSGALFTAFFAHCWVDYSAIGVDDPAAWGFPERCRVDWWENSRRLVDVHRTYARTNPDGLPTLGEDAWGLSACDARDGYLVAGVFPDRAEMRGAVAERDYSTYHPPNRAGDGTVPPYAAGASIMFEPEAAVRALRHYRSIVGRQGQSLVWRSPAAGGFGFADAFNLGAPEGAWVASDDVAIDHGPMLLGIENARTGLVWRYFDAHPWARDGRRRLQSP